MTDTVRIVIPGVACKNASHRAPNGRVLLSKRSRDLRALVSTIATRERLPRITTGRWALYMIVYYHRMRYLDVAVPHIDVDASPTPILDALQRAGVLDDDVRVTEQHIRKEFAAAPRMVVELRRVPIPTT